MTHLLTPNRFLGLALLAVLPAKVSMLAAAVIDASAELLPPGQGMEGWRGGRLLVCVRHGFESYPVLW